MEQADEIRGIANELSLFVSRSLKIFKGEEKKWLYTATDTNDLLAKLRQLKALSNSVVTNTDYEFRTKPFNHQKACFDISKDKRHYALFMEPGTGKTKVTLDNIGYLYEKGLIECAIILAPNGVHRNWIKEISIHLPQRIACAAAYYKSKMRKAEKKVFEAAVQTNDALKIISFNIEAVNTQIGQKTVDTLLSNFKCMMVVDESTRIKNPKAKRTKKVINLGKKALYRRILTGTPVTQGPLDLYTQCEFLNENILGYSSYFSFKSRYAIVNKLDMGFNHQVEVVVGYRNIGELKQKIEPYSFRITKRECLDLPDKIYQKEFIPLSKAQSDIYEPLEAELCANLDSDEYISVDNVLTKMLRLQQIIGGFVYPDDSEEHKQIDKVPPKLKRLQEIVEEIPEDRKIIIWARFVPEIQMIADALKDQKCVLYYGQIDSDTRAEAIESFQNGDARIFIGNQAAGGIGITLNKASYVVYYSNTFSLEDRLQSEDRAHRIGQVNNVTYIDLVCEKTIDEDVYEALRSKKKLSDMITDDKLRMRRKYD